MDKTILLKTQLIEAAKFAKSDSFGQKRLAVIILDNFIELQLSDIVKQKFRWDGIFYQQEKKYSVERRSKILFDYGELIKTCLKEDIINESEQFFLNFCHNVRNNLYHKGKEEELLTQVAIYLLQSIIVKYQPKWKNTRDLTVFGQNIKDPFHNKRKKVINPFIFNETSDWITFLEKHFICIDRRKKNSSRLLSDYLIQKLKRTNDAIEFLKKESGAFYQSKGVWNYNDTLLYYSYLNINHDKIERIKENKDHIQVRNNLNALFRSYRNSWTPKKQERLKVLKESSLQLSMLEAEKSMVKFITLRNEIVMLYEAFSHAAGDLETEIQNAIDRARGK